MRTTPATAPLRLLNHPAASEIAPRPTVTPASQPASSDPAIAVTQMGREPRGARVAALAMLSNSNPMNKVT